jgi:hypothetical protein
MRGHEPDAVRGRRRPFRMVERRKRRRRSCAVPIDRVAQRTSERLQHRRSAVDSLMRGEPAQTNVAI